MVNDDASPPPPLGRVIAQVGGTVDESSAALCIYGDDLDPDDVSARLGIQPTRAFRKGERRNHSPPTRHGAWILEVRGETPTGPDDHLRELLAQVTVAPDVWQTLLRDFELRLSCAVHTTGWNRGFALRPATLAKIADLGIELDFDLYAYPDKGP